MPRIYVEFTRLKQEENNIKEVYSNIDTIRSSFQRTIKQLDWDIKYESDIDNTANKIIKRLEDEVQILKAYQRFLSEVHNQYSRIDNYKSNESLFKSEGIIEAGAIASASWFGYKISDNVPGVVAWVGKANAEAKNNWAYAGVNGYLGKVEAEGTAKAEFIQYKADNKYKENNWDQNKKNVGGYVEAGAHVSASIAKGDAKAGLGNDMLGTEIKADGSLGNATTEAKGVFSFGDNGVNANIKGKAMVSAAEGKASASINLLGMEITGNIGGYAGAAGVEGKLGIEDGKFIMEGGVAALLGLSFGVEIGLNEGGWNNVVNFMKFWHF